MSDILVPDAVATLQPWVDAGVFGAAEVHLAAWVVAEMTTDGVADHLHAPVALALASAVWAGLEGHTCVDLDRIADVVEAVRILDRRRSGDVAIAADDADDATDTLAWPKIGRAHV